MKKLNVIIPLVSLLMIIASCEQEGDPVPAQNSIDEVQAKTNGRNKEMIWSDGQLFETVVTPAVFDGVHGNYDIFYAGSFGLISESKPGDQDYNGGRWTLYTLKYGVMADYSMATSAQDLDINHFEAAGKYVECPLPPRKGNNPIL